MVQEMIQLKEQMMLQIQGARLEIADLKKKKIDKRAKAWESAEGTVDAKKDYVRSQVSDLDCQIDVLNADIELYYNQIGILDEKIELELFKDE